MPRFSDRSTSFFIVPPREASFTLKGGMGQRKGIKIQIKLITLTSTKKFNGIKNSYLWAHARLVFPLRILFVGTVLDALQQKLFAAVPEDAAFSLQQVGAFQCLLKLFDHPASVQSPTHPES